MNSIMYAECHVECHYAEYLICRVSFMLSVMGPAGVFFILMVLRLFLVKCL